MSIVFSLLTAIYSAFMLFLHKGMTTIVAENNAKAQPDKHRNISIIIAARNELANLPRLLKSLAALNYPEESYEIILVNDHSSDGSREYLEQQTLCPRLTTIHFYHDSPPMLGKKAAIQQGIDRAQYDILAFTDADCQLPSTWLQEINRSMDDDTDYLLSYSIMKRSDNGSIYRLKNFERSIYYALASAGLHYHIPFTSSACNMVYRKSLFTKSGGFDGIGHLASGDDDLLLMKMMPNIRKAAYNPSLAMQLTSIDGTDIRQHFHTNVRRASKFKLHPWWLKALSASIFIYFCLFYVSLARLILGNSDSLANLSLLLKTSAEFTLASSHLKLIHRSKLGILYPVQILAFPALFIFYAVRGSLGKYRWK